MYVVFVGGLDIENAHPCLAKLNICLFSNLWHSSRVHVQSLLFYHLSMTTSLETCVTFDLYADYTDILLFSSLLQVEKSLQHATGLPGFKH